MISLVISNDSTQTPPAKAVEKRRKDSEKKVTREKKERESVKKRKRVEKPKKEKAVKKKKRNGKKNVEDDDEDFVVDDQQDEGDDKKKVEKKFKPLREKTTIKPLDDATKLLSPDRKSKIREIGFGCMLDFPFQKILRKLTYFVLKNLETEKMEVKLLGGSKIKITPKKIWEVLGIPMGKNKLECDSPREYDDEFLKAFKEQFYGKKFITTTDLSKLI
ncbi:hypothetical protein Tco_1256572 [Tanacetum coccineum]